MKLVVCFARQRILYLARGKARMIFNKYHEDIGNNIDSAREEIEGVLN